METKRPPPPLCDACCPPTLTYSPWTGRACLACLAGDGLVCAASSVLCSGDSSIRFSLVFPWRCRFSKHVANMETLQSLLPFCKSHIPLGGSERKTNFSINLWLWLHQPWEKTVNHSSKTFHLFTRHGWDFISNDVPLWDKERPTLLGSWRLWSAVNRKQKGKLCLGILCCFVFKADQPRMSKRTFLNACIKHLLKSRLSVFHGFSCKQN